MAVKGTNFFLRKERINHAFMMACKRANTARVQGDHDTVNQQRARMRALRLAWHRLDNHLYPKGRR